MFPLSRSLPLRRCLHSFPPRLPATFKPHFALATTAVAASYLAWRLSADSRPIALDSSAKFSHASPATLPPSQPVFAPEVERRTSSPTPGPEDTDVSGDSKNESSQEPSGPTTGAFNPETGEINWDCPCLGGMAHGPCGQQFRDAFSCFVFSEAEPKGINCVDKFKAMQNCFREHPEIYGDEIMDDDDDDGGEATSSSTSDADDESAANLKKTSAKSAQRDPPSTQASVPS